MILFLLAFLLTIGSLTMTFSWRASPISAIIIFFIYVCIKLLGLSVAPYKNIYGVIYIFTGCGFASLAVLLFAYTHQSTLPETKTSYQITILQHIRSDRYIGSLPSGVGGNIFLGLAQHILPGTIIAFQCMAQPANRVTLSRKISLSILQPLQDSTERFKNRLTLRDIRGYCKPYTVQEIGTATLPFRYAVRYAFHEYLMKTIDDTLYRSLLLGTLVGDSSLFTKEDYDHFVRSGLVHLLVVSGGNIALLLCVLNFFLRRIPLRARWYVSLGVIPLYALLCGGDSSVLRASVMGWITVFALLQGRKVSIWRLLFYATIGLLLWNPYFLVYDIGFLLSFGAVVGIALWQHLQYSKYMFVRGMSALWGATYGTLPILLIFTDGWNMLSIPANIIASFLYTLLYGTMIVHAISLIGIHLFEDFAQIAGAGIAKLLYLVALYADNRKVIIEGNSTLYKGIFAILWYVRGLYIYIYSTRAHGFEPSPSASETDVLPITPRP